MGFSRFSEANTHAVANRPQRQQPLPLVDPTKVLCSVQVIRGEYDGAPQRRPPVRGAARHGAFGGVRHQPASVLARHARVPEHAQDRGELGFTG